MDRQEKPRVARVHLSGEAADEVVVDVIVGEVPGIRPTKCATTGQVYGLVAPDPAPSLPAMTASSRWINSLGLCLEQG